MCSMACVKANKVESKSAGSLGIYHEKQAKELCALHAMNNLLQRKAFTQRDLDQLCANLSPNTWINPHKSFLGLGNYDINILMTALQTQSLQAEWFDKRKDVKSVCVGRVCGFIFNVPSEWRVGFIKLPLQRKHWLTLRRLRGSYYNLDSKLGAPKSLGDRFALLEYLRQELGKSSRELFIIVTSDVASQRSWLHADDVTSDTCRACNEADEPEWLDPLAALACGGAEGGGQGSGEGRETDGDERSRQACGRLGNGNGVGGTCVEDGKGGDVSGVGDGVKLSEKENNGRVEEGNGNIGGSFRVAGSLDLDSVDTDVQ